MCPDILSAFSFTLLFCDTFIYQVSSQMCGYRVRPSVFNIKVFLPRIPHLKGGADSNTCSNRAAWTEEKSRVKGGAEVAA